MHCYCNRRWSEHPDTVLLHHIPHKPLTRPAKLADFDFCAPEGTPYPKQMQAALDVTAAGKMNGLVVWFDLHLAEGVSISSGGCTAMFVVTSQIVMGECKLHVGIVAFVIKDDWSAT